MSEIITDGGRRRHWGATEKLRIVEETLDGRDSISVVARRNGVAPNLLYRWRRLMLEGGSVADAGDDDVISNRQVREMEIRIRELERQLGHKTLEVDILNEALERSGPKKASLLHALVVAGDYPYPFGEGRIASNWRDLEVALVQAPVFALVLATVRWLR